MLNDKKILAVILARGGSKGIINKNIYPLIGKPLIHYTLEACDESLFIDKVVVSTDSKDIKREVEERCDIIDRPEHLSGDLASSTDCLIHALNYYNNEYDFIVFPQVTHPVRRKGLIDTCLSQCVCKGFDSLISAKSFSPFFFHIDDDDKVTFNDRSSIINRKMRQCMGKTELFYYDVGNLYVIKSTSLLERGSRIGFNPTFFEMRESECTDIHNQDDIKIAELMLKLNRNG